MSHQSDSPELTETRVAKPRKGFLRRKATNGAVIGVAILAVLVGATGGSALTATVFHDQLQGDRGAQGVAGVAGIDGVDGDRGKRGKRGPQGPAGQAGYNGEDGATIIEEQACSNDIDVPLPYC